MKPVIVIGTGMAGAGAMHRLRAEGVPYQVFDMNDHFGGHTFSYELDGFVFDEGPHISFTKDEGVRKLFAENVRNEYVSFNARVNNYWQGHWIKHPAQCNLYGLPTDLVVNVLKDMIVARPPAPPPSNYEEWLVASYGRTFAETFPMQYGRKYHTVEARRMSLDWLGPRLYQPKIEEVLTGALQRETPEVHYVQEFRYPSRGGFLSFLRPFAETADLHLEHLLVDLDPATRTLTFANGRAVSYEHLVSSVPLPELIRVMRKTPPEVTAAAERLACTTCVLVNLGVARRDLSDWHWTYFYDDDFCFTRVSFPHLFSPHNAPEGMGSIQCELYFSPKYRPLTTPPETWIDPTIADLRRCGLLRDDDRIVVKHAMTVRYANVIFDLDRAGALAIVHGYLDELGIRYGGRYGEWGYQWTDESFLSGQKAAQAVLDSLTSA